MELGNEIQSIQLERGKDLSRQFPRKTHKCLKVHKDDASQDLSTESMYQSQKAGHPTHTGRDRIEGDSIRRGTICRSWGLPQLPAQLWKCGSSSQGSGQLSCDLQGNSAAPKKGRSTCLHKTYEVFTAILFMVDKSWKATKCPPIHE